MSSEDAIAKLWEALVDIRIYMQKGLANQLKTAISFSGDDMYPLLNAQKVLLSTKVRIPQNIFSASEDAFTFAVDGLNKLLNIMRLMLSYKRDSLDWDIALHKANKHLCNIFKEYTKKLDIVEKLISKVEDHKSNTQITVSGPVYGPLNVAGRDIGSTQLNLTLGDIIGAIEVSKSTEAEKREAKSKLQEFLSHPLVTAIVGGMAGKLSG